MPAIKVNEATPGAREVNLDLVQDSDGKTPVTSFTFAAGDLRIKKQGGAWANAAGSNPTHTEDGVWTYQLTAGEVDTLGELLVKFNKATIRMHKRTIDVVAYQPRDGVRMGMTALPNADAEAAGGLYTRGSGAGQINQSANGQVDTRTVAMSANVVDSNAIATDAIGSAELAATAATKVAAAVWDELRASHVAAGSFGQGVASVQGNVTGSVASVTGAVGSVTGNVGGNVVGSVASVTGAVGSVTGNVGGNVTGSVGSVAAGGITAASIAAAAITAGKFATDAVDANALAGSAVTEIQAGLATSAVQATIASGVVDIQGRLPATLNGANMRASVEVMQANTVNANALATDAGTELAAAVDVTLTAAHGAGAWNGAGGGGDPNAVLQALLAPNAVDGSLAKGLLTVMARLNGNMQIDQYVYVDGRPTSMRIRAFANETDANAGTNPIDTSRVTVVNGPNGPTSYKAAHEP